MMMPIEKHYIEKGLNESKKEQEERPEDKVNNTF